MAWDRLLASVGGSSEGLIRVRQVHGARVRVLAAGTVPEDAARQLPDGDALASNQPGLVLAVQTADCVPILMADAVTGSVAAVHAGWRGTCAGVVASAVGRMAAVFGTTAAHLVVAIGPSIGPADYEVGASLVGEFLGAGHAQTAVDRWFLRSGAALRLDLWTANRDQLTAAGVRPDRVFTCGLSTVRHPVVLDSYRRDGAHAGRMAALIRVPGA